MHFELRDTHLERHVETDDARAVLRMWQEHCRDGKPPLFDDVWLSASAFHPYLMVTKPHEAGDWAYVVVGAETARLFGPEEPRKTARCLPPGYADFAIRCFDNAATSGKPIYVIHTGPDNLDVLLWERLILPCQEADGAPVLITHFAPLEFAHDLVRAVLESTPNAILRARCIRDGKGAIVDAVCLLANERATQFLHRSMDELIEGCVLELFPNFLDTGVWNIMVAAVNSREPRQFELEYWHSGQRQWFAVTVVPQGDGFTLTLADVTDLKFMNQELDRARGELMAANEHLEQQAAELERAVAEANAARADIEIEVESRKVLEEELRRLALTDGLTGLANRAALGAHGQSLAVAAHGRRQPLSIIAVDLDNFKGVNDTYGHAGGDRVLVAVAALLQDMCRADLDIAGRLGGEEFVIILPKTSLDEAAAIAERLRVAIPLHKADIEGEMVGVTASFGVAQLRKGEEFEEMLLRSDAALYQSKRDGRDRITVARENSKRAAA